MPNQEHEREREIKHIATGTYPQPRGWTTPSSSWRAPGWWRWPPVRDPPSGRVPEQGPDWFLVATEACGGGTPDLSSFLMVLGYVGIYRRKKSVGSYSRGPRDRGPCPVGGAPPISYAPRGSSDLISKPPGWYSSKKSWCRRFHSVWTPFDIPFLQNPKTGNKTTIWDGPLVSRLVPKMI